MRIATLIISLIVSIFLTIQSFAIMAAGGISSSLSDNAADKAAGENLSSGGAAGIWAAIFWVVGAGFVLVKPKVSMWIFGASAVICVIGAASSEFSDLWIYAVISAAFCAASRAGVKEKAKQDEEKRAAYQADLVAAAQAINAQGSVPPPEAA
jgi:hypothetical protein